MTITTTYTKNLTDPASDHAGAPPEQVLMNAAPVRRHDYGNGDVAGLRALTAACRPGG